MCPCRTGRVRFLFPGSGVGDILAFFFRDAIGAILKRLVGGGVDNDDDARGDIGVCDVFRRLLLRVI